MPWYDVFRKPASFADGAPAQAWFERMAYRLLNGCRLVAAGQPHRLTEVEFYYYSDAHPDVFAHRDPIQVEQGRWYFHRSHGAYRVGSRKGLDVTFGHPGAHAGILFRGLEKPSGDLIDGPSLLVDHLLALTGHASVASLDQAIDARPAWEPENPLRLEEAPEEERPVVQAARVGLALWGSPGPTGEKRWRYLMRPYRFLTEPGRIKKGKPQIILALHLAGMSPERILELTRAPRRTIERYLTDFEAGRKTTDPTPYFGVDLTPATLCKVHGTWSAAHG